jgi:ABC-type branched-subunit amino acid transport system substrate-binding protein
MMKLAYSSRFGMRAVGLSALMLGLSGAGFVSSAGAASKPTGKPVVLAHVGDTVPGYDGAGLWAPGLKAAVGYINKELGGWGGRPVELFTCNPQGDPAATTSCARRALAKKPLASLGNSFNWAANGLPLFKKANVVGIMAATSDVLENTPYNIQFGGGGSGEYAGEATYACRKGAKKIAMIGLEYAGAQDLNDRTIGRVAKKCGADVKFTFINPQSADLGATVTQVLTSKPDFVILEFGAAQISILLKTLKQAGFNRSHVLLNSGSLDTRTIKSFGSNAEGVTFSSQYDTWDNTKSRDIQIYRKAMRKYSGTSGYGATGQNAFASVMTLYAACKKIGFSKCTSKAAMDFFNGSRGRGFHVFMNKKIVKPPAKLYSIKQPAVPLFQWKGGKLHAVLGGQWQNGLS